MCPAIPSFHASTCEASKPIDEDVAEPATNLPALSPWVPPIKCARVEPQRVRPAALLMSPTETLFSKSCAANSLKRVLADGTKGTPHLIRSVSACSQRSASSGSFVSCVFLIWTTLSVAGSVTRART